MGQLMGQVLHERYHIQALLGRKTGRRTFRCQDLKTEQTVIIKLLLLGPDFTWDDLKLFEREAKILQSLDHPAIPKYLDFFEVETDLGRGFALVQSYIEARSLQTWIQSGRSFSEPELKEIASTLLDILHYLHNRRPAVIHRDIKPSNLLICDRGSDSPHQIYLVDFGSVQLAPQDGTITVVGTYGYMAPEQFGGRSHPNSDLYSLGATLIYLATGQHPADLPHQDLHIQFEQSLRLSKSFTHWIQWLTEPNSSRRPASAKNALQILKDGSDIISKGAALPSKRWLSLAIRNPDSNIYLETTPTLLKVKTPSDQIQIPHLKTLHVLILSVGLCYPCVMSALGFWHSSITGLITFLYVAILYYLGLKNRIDSYDAVLSLEHDSLRVQLSPNNLPSNIKDFTIISNASLQSILVESCKSDQCRLQLNCHTDTKTFYIIGKQTKTFYITGDRLEIEWLCNELNEWTALHNLTDSGFLTTCHLNQESSAEQEYKIQESEVEELDSVS